jgi:hypothetical protein
MIAFFPQIGDGLLNNIYPFWSTVIDNEPWLSMVSAK